MYPSDSLGVDTLSKKKDELEKLYDMGYNDGHIIKNFFNEYKSTKI
ncbi:MAG: hypothetical protein GXZ08_01070 [Tissierellia bacterium]|nr:hypothetical protein [Tissierellia bacterium]